MDTLNTQSLAEQVDEIAMVAPEIEATLSGDVFLVDGVVEEIRTTSGDRKVAYASLRPFETGASKIAVLGVPQGRISGIKAGASVRFYVTAVAGKETLFRYAGHQYLAVTSLAAAAKPAPLAKASDVQKTLEANAKAAPKVKL